MEKQSLTQQRHTFTNQKKCTTTRNKCKKLKPGLVASYDVRPGNGQGISVLRKFVTYLLTYLNTYPLTYSPRTHTGLCTTCIATSSCSNCSPGLEESRRHSHRYQCCAAARWLRQLRPSLPQHLQPFSVLHYTSHVVNFVPMANLSALKIMNALVHCRASAFAAATDVGVKLLSMICTRPPADKCTRYLEG